MAEPEPQDSSGRGDQREPPIDRLVAEEEAAAAAEAARIGGSVPPVSDDPAMEPLYEAGEGDEDGWELAEAELIDNATHSDGEGDPELDVFPPEAETDRATAAYGESDGIRSTERDEDAGDEAGAPE